MDTERGMVVVGMQNRRDQFGGKRIWGEIIGIVGHCAEFVGGANQ